MPPGRHQIEFRYTGLSLVASDRVQFGISLKAPTPAGWRRERGASVQYNLLPPALTVSRDCVQQRPRLERNRRFADGESPAAFLRDVVVPRAGRAGCGRAGGRARSGIRSPGGCIGGWSELARQQAVERERARIAKDIHDDLGANLTLIAVLGDLAQQEKTVERVEKMASTARQAVKSLDEIVWAVNPRNDTLAHLIDYTGQFAVDYLRAAGVRCLLDVPERAPAREISTAVRHNVFLVVKEALQNIVKHAHATEVWLRVNATARRSADCDRGQREWF